MSLQTPNTEKKSSRGAHKRATVLLELGWVGESSAQDSPPPLTSGVARLQVIKSARKGVRKHLLCKSLSH